jgi:hypothetical protein
MNTFLKVWETLRRVKESMKTMCHKIENITKDIRNYFVEKRTK